MLLKKNLTSPNNIALLLIFIFVYYFYVLIDGVGPGDDLSNLLSMYNSNLSLYDEIKGK